MENLYRYNEHILTLSNKAVDAIEPIKYWDMYWKGHIQLKECNFSEFNNIFKHLIFIQNENKDRKQSELKILECGCGNGNYLSELHNQGYDITGIDIVDSVKNKELNFEIGDVRNLQFNDNSFDVCMSLAVIGYFLDIQKIFFEMNRVVKTFGFIVLKFSHLTTNRKLIAYKENKILNEEPKGVFTCFHEVINIINLVNSFSWDLCYYMPDLTTEAKVFSINNKDNSFSNTFCDYDTIIMVFRKSF